MEFVTSSILLSGNRDSATRNVTYGRKSPTQNATLSTLLFLFHPRAFAGAPVHAGPRGSVDRCAGKDDREQAECGSVVGRSDLPLPRAARPWCARVLRREKG